MGEQETIFYGGPISPSNHLLAPTYINIVITFDHVYIGGELDLTLGVLQGFIQVGEVVCR